MKYKSTVLKYIPTKLVESNKWNLNDLQNIICGIILLIDFFIVKAPNLLIKIALAGLLITSFFIPYIKRFTIAALPIFTWLITFYACQFIPTQYRPQHIFVNLLPTLERILYGANLSEIISKHTHPVLDILAWIPYGLIHFSFPFVLAGLLFCFGPPGALVTFASAFGFMNLAGVLTQLFFPNASPWYELSYGSAPADYSIPGEPGGLSRIDEILGLDLYGSTFGTSPMVFGAFPSLHSGCASLEMMFVSYLFPRLRPLAAVYVLWMWFATMYLTHHYMIDLVGGSMYALLTFAVAYRFLPLLEPSFKSRLEYLGIQVKEGESRVMALLWSLEPVVEELPTHKVRVWQQNKPEPISIPMREKIEEAPCLSPSSEHWSSTSEPSSPITPFHSSTDIYQLGKP